ncbi:hypothetical protein OAN92_02700 [Candidatus Pelagibacter ubique]|nr:hypothetical protein [Candidatus Pelagibacter ubique]
MKKILSIIFVYVLLSGNSYAEVINLLCTPITGKKEIATLSIDTKSQKVRWQGSSNQNTYNLQNGVFGYTQTKPDSKFHVRHSLNRYSGVLTVEAYDFDIDNSRYPKFVDMVNARLNSANKTTKDKNFFFTVYYEELGNIKRDFEFEFNCEKSEKKF